MRQFVGVIATSAVLASSLPVAALAQTRPSGANTAAPATPNSPVNLSPNPNQNTPGQELRPAASVLAPPMVNTGLFPGFGNQLLDDGIDFHGALLDHAVSNASTGNVPGNTSQLGILRPEVDFNLGKIAGVQGGFLHASLTWWFSKTNAPGSIAQTGGVLDGYQTTPILEASTLSRLTYEQLLLNDRLDLEVGKSNVHEILLHPQQP